MSARITSVAVTSIIAVASVWLAAGCATMNVNSFAERGMNLRQYRTYNWGPPDTWSTGDPRLDNNRFFDERVRGEVEKELARRGFEKTASDLDGVSDRRSNRQDPRAPAEPSVGVRSSP